MIPSFSPSIIRSIAEAWGHDSYGGDTPNVNLTKVADVRCEERACITRKNDGTTEAWEHIRYGGDVSNVNLTNVTYVMCGESTRVVRIPG